MSQENVEVIRRLLPGPEVDIAQALRKILQIGFYARRADAFEAAGLSEEGAHADS
jgi:hypothetical protein